MRIKPVQALVLGKRDRLVKLVLKPVVIQLVKLKPVATQLVKLRRGRPRQVEKLGLYLIPLKVS
jgi:hypothetical protein